MYLLPSINQEKSYTPTTVQHKWGCEYRVCLNPVINPVIKGLGTKVQCEVPEGILFVYLILYFLKFRGII